MISKEIKQTFTVPTGERDEKGELVLDKDGQPLTVERTAVKLEKSTARFEILLVTGSVRASRLWTWKDDQGAEIQSKIENLEMSVMEFVKMPGFLETYNFIKARFDEKDPV